MGDRFYRQQLEALGDCPGNKNPTKRTKKVAWDDDKKAQAVSMYEDASPTPETSMEIVKDIAEELDRLKVHILSMQDLLSSSGLVGKKLDFLSQELNREVNTICSKSQFSDLTKVGIEMKTLVDQFREQVQNVE